MATTVGSAQEWQLGHQVELAPEFAGSDRTSDARGFESAMDDAVELLFSRLSAVFDEVYCDEPPVGPINAVSRFFWRGRCIRNGMEAQGLFEDGQKDLSGIGSPMGGLELGSAVAGRFFQQSASVAARKATSNAARSSGATVGNTAGREIRTLKDVLKAIHGNGRNVTADQLDDLAAFARKTGRDGSRANQKLRDIAREISSRDTQQIASYESVEKPMLKAIARILFESRNPASNIALHQILKANIKDDIQTFIVDLAGSGGTSWRHLLLFAARQCPNSNVSAKASNILYKR